ncbi:MAG: sulfotransferase [Acidobacteria bacterium]|nr:sulfotransferase [Acidobacteriota bacterium]
MTIYIAGMHRSGTSMITRLLNLCGLYLGPQEEISATGFDNAEGFWENSHFVELNEALLGQLGGSWDWPPTMPEGWELGAGLSRFRHDAGALVKQFNCYELWGWKDPRNSLLFPFWRRVIPDLKILICLRNPLEVAQSLQQRGHSSLDFGLQLWLTYMQRLLADTQPSERVVTHYHGYFYNPQAELQRVLNRLQIATSEEVIAQACSTISEPLRHSWVTTQELRRIPIPDEILNCYMKLYGEAEAIYHTAKETALPTQRKRETSK